MPQQQQQQDVQSEVHRECLETQVVELQALCAAYGPDGVQLGGAGQQPPDHLLSASTEEWLCWWQEAQALRPAAMLLLPSEGEAEEDGEEGDGGRRVAGRVEEFSGSCQVPDVQLGGASVALQFLLPPLYPQLEAAELSVECSASCSGSMHVALNQCVREVAQRAAAGASSLEQPQGDGSAVGGHHDAGTASRSGHPAHADAGAGGGACCLLEAMQQLMELAQRLQEQEEERGRRQPGAGEGDAGRAAGGPGKRVVARALIWFHHIKSLTKRKHIASDARELGLGGACKPGFPGVIVVEGELGRVREFVARIRALSWQAMQVRGWEEEEEHDALAPSAGQAAADMTWLERMRKLPSTFTELHELGGLSDLGAMCKAGGLEELFNTALKL